MTPNINPIQTGVYIFDSASNTATITKTGSKDGVVGHGLTQRDTVKATWNNDFGSFYPIASVVDESTFTVNISAVSSVGIVSFTKATSVGIPTTFGLSDITSGGLKGLKGFW